MKNKDKLLSQELFHSDQKIQTKILKIRGKRVMIDADIAELYDVTTKRLNEQIKRNIERFPEDFMFQITVREKDEVVANCDHLEKLKYSSQCPYAFTEHGAIMVASVLNSSRAIEMSVYVVRAFVALREYLPMHRELDKKIRLLEQKISSHDDAIRSIVSAIRQLMNPPKTRKPRKIGF